MHPLMPSAQSSRLKLLSIAATSLIPILRSHFFMGSPGRQKQQVACPLSPRNQHSITFCRLMHAHFPEKLNRPVQRVYITAPASTYTSNLTAGAAFSILYSFNNMMLFFRVEEFFFLFRNPTRRFI
jgi:hypothetical protein